jgi:hypothetical protein
MEGIRLKMEARQAYETIKGLEEHGGNKNRAALALGCSRRSVDRHLAGYRAEGKAYFVHGNQGRRPARAVDAKTAAQVADLYANKYFGANFAHFAQMAREREGIALSESAIRSMLAEAGILSPRATRRTRRNYRKRMEAEAAAAKSRGEAERARSKIVDAEDAHPRRPRCSMFGEMIQMDASLHLWFGNKKATLHLAVDDATGRIVGARFEEQETLLGYCHVLEQILKTYGIPYMFYTDRRTVFECRRKGGADDADDSFTQFGYACKQLGILIETTSVPQAKGRVERLNQTMQSRLPVEFRLEGVSTLGQANEYLPGFIEKYNARFALPHHSIRTAFEAQPSPEKIDRTLAVIAERTVDTGHSVRFDSRHFRTVNADGAPVYFYKGTKGIVIRTFGGALYFSVDEGLFSMDEIPPHELASRNFDFRPPKEPPAKRYIPPLDHPWRRAAFAAFVKKQARRAAEPS